MCIRDRYMEYVDQMKKDNLDTLSEFLVMAATLLDIKSKMLLPKKEEEAVSYTHLDVYKRQVPYS